MPGWCRSTAIRFRHRLAHALVRGLYSPSLFKTGALTLGACLLVMAALMGLGWAVPALLGMAWGWAASLGVAGKVVGVVGGLGLGVATLRAVWALSCAVGEATGRVDHSHFDNVNQWLAEHGLCPRANNLAIHQWELRLMEAALAPVSVAQAQAASLELTVPASSQPGTPRSRF